MGRRLAGRDTLIGSYPRTLRRRHGVHRHKRAVAAAGDTVRFADGEALEVSTVIWATGFRYDHSWIKVPVFDEQGRVVHRRGVTEARGLYFLGLTWQYTRGSALLGWVGEDASYIAERIEAFRATGTPSERKEPARAQ
jgi:putative flavoprotein involved in K+ transport